MEQSYQNVLALWHHSHINMKSVVSWHYLMADIRAIRNWNVASVGFNYSDVCVRGALDQWRSSYAVLILGCLSLPPDKDHATR